MELSPREVQSKINGLIICLWVVSVTYVAISIPLVLDKVPPNRAYGYRSAETLSDPGVWYEANRFSGMILLVGGGVAGIIGGVLWRFRRGLSLCTAFIAVLLTILTPTVIMVIATRIYISHL